MLSLNVICGLGPQIKNSGYAYDRGFNVLRVEWRRIKHKKNQSKMVQLGLGMVKTIL